MNMKRKGIKESYLVIRRGDGEMMGEKEKKEKKEESCKRVAREMGVLILKDRSIREVAREMGVSKTTVYNYIHRYLVDESEYGRIKEKLKENIKNRSFKGGMATKEMWRVLNYERKNKTGN